MPESDCLISSSMIWRWNLVKVVFGKKRETIFLSKVYLTSLVSYEQFLIVGIHHLLQTVWVRNPSTTITYKHGQKNWFCRPIYRRKIGFRPAPRRKSRGKIGKILDFSPKNRKIPIFPPKNRDCRACALVLEFLKKYR